MPRDLLPILGDPDDSAEAARLRLVRVFLLAFGMLRGWLWLALAAGERYPAIPGLAAAGVQTVAFVLVLRPGTAWLAPRIALPAILLQLALTFPQVANHSYLEAICVSLLCVARRDDAPGERAALRALRGVALLVLFHSGLQKLLYGHYLHGDLLAYTIGRGDPFAALFRPLLAPEEIARLAGYDPSLDGAGPYRVTAPLFVALSNLLWIAEVLLPFALAWRRTRLFAAAAAIVLVLSIQLGAREIGSALLLGALLALSLPLPARLRRAPPASPRAASPAFGLDRRRVVSGILLAVALWPLAHRGLVARYHIDPSRFAGWASHATAVVPEIAVLFEKQGSGLGVLDERTLPRPARDALERFRERRTAYGDLVRADDLARAVFAARSDLAWVLVATQRLRLDPATARMTSDRGQQLYERAELLRSE